MNHDEDPMLPSFEYDNWDDGRIKVACERTHRLSHGIVERFMLVLPATEELLRRMKLILVD